MGWICLPGDVCPTVARPLFHSLRQSRDVSRCERGSPQLISFPNSSHNSLNCPNCVSQFSLLPGNALQYQCQWLVPMLELSGPLFLASSTMQPAHIFGGGIYCFMPNASLLYHWSMPSPPPFTSLQILLVQSNPPALPCSECSITRCWLFVPLQNTAQHSTAAFRQRGFDSGVPTNQPA